MFHFAEPLSPRAALIVKNALARRWDVIARHQEMEAAIMDSIVIINRPLDPMEEIATETSSGVKKRSKKSRY
jgi:hypothetical protein